MADVTFTKLGAALAETALSQVADLAGSVSVPITVGLSNAAWYAAPALWPGVGGMISAYHAGTVSWGMLEHVLRHNGAALSEFQTRPNHHLAWQGIVAASRPMLGVNGATQAYASGFISGDWWKHELTRAGYKENWQHNVFQMLHKPVDFDLVTKLDRLGVNLPGGSEFWYSASGYNANTDYGRRDLLWQDRKVWNPTEGITLVNRGLITSQEYYRNLLAGHYVTRPQQDQARSLTLPVPTLNEMLHLFRAGGNGFDGGALDNLLVEMPDWIRDSAKWHGMLNPIGTYTDAQGGLAQLNMAQLEWASHWHNPTLMELASIRALVRPDTVDRWRALGLNAAPITDDNIRYLLRAAGVHPNYRDAVIATSYTPIGLRHIYFVARDSNWNVDQFYGRFLGLGFAPDDARLMAAAGKNRADDERWPWIHNTPNAEYSAFGKAVVDASVQGTLTDEQVRGRLRELHFREASITPMLETAKASDRLEQANAEAKAVNTLVRSARRQQIEAILVRYRSRDLPRNSAITRLETFGVKPEDATKLVDAAAATERAARVHARHERVERYRLDSFDKLVSGVQSNYRFGLLTRQQANSILARAGLPQDAIATHLDFLEALQNQEQVKTAVAAVRSQYMHGELTQTDALALLLRAGLTPDASQRRLAYWAANLHQPRKIASAEKILSWVSKGLMPVEAARVRLLNMGWTGIDAQLALASASQTLQAFSAGRAKASAQSRLQAGKQLASLSKQMDQARKSLQSDIKRLTPIATLGKWVKAGIMTPETAKERLILMGEPSDIADLYLEEWANGSTKVSTSKSKAKVVTPTNGTADATTALP